jgi:hypothetical protein
VVILDALTAAVTDLAVGLALGGFALAVIFLCIRRELQDARKQSEDERGPVQEPADPWDSLPPKWSAPQAESDLDSGKRAA